MSEAIRSIVEKHVPVDTKILLEQEKALSAAKEQKIQDLLKQKKTLESDYQTNKKMIASDLKMLGYHTPRPRKTKEAAK